MDHVAARLGAAAVALMAVSCSADRVGPASRIDAATEIVLHAGSALPTRPAVVRAEGPWNAFQLREPGNAVHDPVTGRWIMTYTGQSAADGTAAVGSSYSRDGRSWAPDPENPVTGDVGAEDPYLVRRTDGDLYRNPGGRALMFTEQKSGHGLDLWHSAPGALSGWERIGPVLAEGPDGGWDGFDRSSPVVIADGGLLVMLFEGRGLGNGGEIGYATSQDEGLHWTVGPHPIIGRGAKGSWNAFSVVADDVIGVGSRWVLYVHGARAGAAYTSGRYVSSDPPRRWAQGSFVELPGNPFDRSNSVMPLGDDPGAVVWLDSYEALRLASVHQRIR